MLRKILISALLVTFGAVGALGSGYYYVTRADSSPVILVEKQPLGEFLFYVRLLEAAVSQCQANKSI